MIRSFKYRLCPNAHQAEVLEAWFEQCRQIYNAALEQRVTAYKQQGRSLSYMEQQKDLTALRASDKVWGDVSVHAQRSALHRLDRSFAGFFARCARGDKPGFPRFRSNNQYSSFTLHRGAWSPQHSIVSGKRLHVHKIGHVKLDLYRPIAGEVRDVSIWRDGAKRWWVSFACHVGEAPEKKAVRSMVGIDLGLKKTLAQRLHDCPCGLVIDRDHNAAINILTRGSRVLELEQSGVEGEVSSTKTSKGQGRAGAPRYVRGLAMKDMIENGSQRRS